MSNSDFLKAIEAIDNGNLSYFESDFRTEWVGLIDPEGGWTLLHYASSRCQPEIVQCLLKQHQFDPDQSDNFQQVALHSAVLSNDLKILKLLLDYGASPVKYDSQNRSPLNLATCHGSKDCAKHLFPYYFALNTEYNNYYFQHVLIDAVTYGQLELLDFYLNEGLKLDLEDENQYSLTHLAVFESKPEILSYLISKGARLVPLPKHDGRDLLQITENKKVRKILQQAIHSKT